MNGLRLESASESDIGSVLEIERRSFAKPWTRFLFLEELSNPNSFNYLIKCGDTVAAYICFRLAANEMDILRIAVAEQWRRKGLASIILRESLKSAEEKNTGAAYLEVGSENLPAVSFYKKLGFAEVGKRLGYYSESGENALVMKRMLQRHAPRFAG